MLSACVQMPSLPAIAEVERYTGLPGGVRRHGHGPRAARSARSAADDRRRRLAPRQPPPRRRRPLTPRSPTRTRARRSVRSPRPGHRADGVDSTGDGVAPPHRLASRLRAVLRGDLRAPGGRHRRHPGSDRRPPRRVPAGGVGDDPPARVRGPRASSTAASSSRRRRPGAGRTGGAQAPAVRAVPHRHPRAVVGAGPRRGRQVAARHLRRGRAARSTACSGNPNTCPHGNPIPGTVYEPPDYVPLNQLTKDDDFTVARIPEELEFTPGMLEFLEDAVVVPGRDGPGDLNLARRNRHRRGRRQARRHRLVRQRPGPRPHRRLTPRCSPRSRVTRPR